MIERPLRDAADTEGLGAALARAIPWHGSRALALFLQGELGAGKTTLARGLLRALGVEGTVRSPSYTLLECYDYGGHRLLHLDLYRLGSRAEVEQLGLRDELQPGALLLIEWPERAPEALPPPDLRIALRFTAEARSARLEGASPAGAAWLQAAFQGIIS